MVAARRSTENFAVIRERCSPSKAWMLLLHGEKKRRNNGRAFLPGFGPKTYSLLNLFFAEVGAVSEMVDAIPVDRHIMRLVSIMEDR